MKRLFIFMVMLLVAATAAWSSAFAGEAETPEPIILSYNGYQYEITENDTVYIRSYTGEDTEIVIPSEIDGAPVTHLSANAFSGNKAITSVTIPGSITQIPYGAFMKCSNLTTVVLEHGVKQFGYRPQGFGIVQIPGGAFQGCTNLESITIPDSVTLIGAYTFSGCANLKNIEIPDSVKTIMQSAFSGCRSLESIELPAADMANNLFSRCASLKRVVLPAGLSVIPSATFEDCTSLESIEIPDTVKTIGRAAFKGCTSLIQAHIPDHVNNINEDAFSGCTSLIQAHIPASVTSINSGAYSGCTSLTDVLIPNTVTYISSSAFEGTPWLGAFSDEFLIINHNLLAYNGAGGAIVIPDGVISIADAFYKNDRITSITIPGSVAEIEDAAFLGCTGLTTVVLLEGVATISDAAFKDCTALTNIEIPNSMTSIDSSAFENCTSLAEITLSDHVTFLSSYLFRGCTSLHSITFSPNLTGIGSYAFAGCTSLKSITLPQTVTTVQSWAFANCENLKAVYFEGPAPMIGAADATSGAFSGNAEGFTVYYSPGAEGFTSPVWEGYPSAEYVSEPATDATAESAIPAEYVGTWVGTSGNISLIFEISADGRAKFTFEQGSYKGSDDVALSVADDTFTMEIKADDPMTASCGGSYSYADGVLTVNVVNVFKTGRTFSYTVECQRLEAAEENEKAAAPGIPEEYIGKWAGISGNISLSFEVDADGSARVAFEQGSYSESGELLLSVQDNTFTVEIDENDPITKSCGGSYSYADGILTVRVDIAFVRGGSFSYTVDCERVEE